MSAKKKKEKEEEPGESIEVEESLIEAIDICQHCRGYGFIITEEGEAQPCECREGRLATERLSAAQIPKKFAKKSLANFRASDKARKALLEKAGEFAQNFAKKSDQHVGILMIGPIGSGKTHLAVAILREIIVKGFSGLYYNVPELLNDLRETYVEESEQVESDILDAATEADLLVLDDLGAERTSGWVRDRLYLIINRRYELLKPIIVTTNLAVKELTEQVGDRIVSRLYEMCPLILEFPREDYRRQILAQQHKRQQREK